MGDGLKRGLLSDDPAPPRPDLLPRPTLILPLVLQLVSVGVFLVILQLDLLNFSSSSPSCL